MAAIKTVILDALNDLVDTELKDFKWHLTQDSIPRAKLEKADRHDVVDLMVQHFGSADAGSKTLQVLKRIKQNECAKCLEEKLKEVSGDVSAQSAASASAGNVDAPVPSAPKSEVSVKITASSGATVKAPVVHGGVFNGSVTFN